MRGNSPVTSANHQRAALQLQSSPPARSALAAPWELWQQEMRTNIAEPYRAPTTLLAPMVQFCFHT